VHMEVLEDDKNETNAYTKFTAVERIIKSARIHQHPTWALNSDPSIENSKYLRAVSSLQRNRK
jgi:hypothetical protein